VLARELDCLASALSDELSALIAEFAGALAWRDAEVVQLRGSERDIHGRALILFIQPCHIHG